MPRYAVAQADLFDNDLTIVLVTADNWKAALVLHPKIVGIDFDDNPYTDDLEGYKRIAWDCDNLIDCVEVI